jgi:hypothetical protein
MNQESIIDRMWREKIQNAGGICMCCNKCGGAYAWKCSCARARFQPSPEQIAEFTRKEATQRRHDVLDREKRLLRDLQRVQEDKKQLGL